jgi:hypothetical protein
MNAHHASRHLHRGAWAAWRCAGLCLLASVAGAAQAAPVFVNGSFETPALFYQAPGGGDSTALPGWTTALSGVEHYHSAAYGLGPAADGVMAVDLAYVTSMAGGAIEQALDTVAGETYTVAFHAGNTRSSGRTGSGIVKISIDGVHLTDIATPDALTGLTVWSLESFSFTAADSSSVVRFWNDQNPLVHFALIDGVSVAESGGGHAVPVPGTSALLAVGLGLLGIRRTRGRAPSVAR